MQNTNLTKSAKRQRFFLRLKQQWTLQAFALLGIAFLIIFSYIPMVGIVLAFNNYKPKLGLAGFFTSEWVGFKWFKEFLTDPQFWPIFRNTLVLSVLKLAFSFPLPIIFALALNEMRMPRLKRIIQTVSYLPHFISWVLLAGIFVKLLGGSGLVNKLLVALGGKNIIFLGDNKWFPFTLIFTHIWKEFGYGTIVYLAAVTGVNVDLYEAASIDGAGHWKQMLHVTLPAIVPTIILMTALAIGNIMSAGFDQVFNMYNEVVYESGDILDTLVYRMGFGAGGQFGLSTAAGLFKSVISCTLVIVSYRVAYKTSGYRVF